MSKQRRSNWSDLAPELLELILQRLTLMDYLKCREVCSSWRAAVNDALAIKRRCPPAPQPPFLLLLPTPPNNFPNLLSLTQDRLYTMSTKLHVLIDRIRSVQGWLIFQRYYKKGIKQPYTELSFLNPVSGAKFKLPKLSLFSGFERKNMCVDSIVFSSAPDSPEFLVASLLLIKRDGEFKQQLAFCKVTDKSWTLIDTVESQTMIFYHIAISGCKLYAITRNAVFDFVIVFNLGDPNAITAEHLVMLDPKPIPILSRREVQSGLRHSTDEETYMLAIDPTNGELLLVVQLRDKTVDLERSTRYLISTKGFRVFKLDMSGPRWLEINSLGDRFLLLDWTGVRVISATHLDDGPGEFIGGNCIFFCYANPLSIVSYSNHDLGVFSFKDKSIKRFSLNSSLPVSFRDLWFMPSPW